MRRRSIRITESDMRKLQRLLESGKQYLRRDLAHLLSLEDELRRAEEVSPYEIPPDVVTMNSRVRVRDLHRNEETTYTLVFPGDADISKNRVSVLAPLGTALLGYKAGDVIQLEVPSGVRWLKVEEVLYQPEAAGVPA